MGEDIERKEREEVAPSSKGEDKDGVGGPRSGCGEGCEVL